MEWREHCMLYAGGVPFESELDLATLTEIFVALVIPSNCRHYYYITAAFQIVFGLSRNLMFDVI
jgi:hypothetical protein